MGLSSQHDIVIRLLGPVDVVVEGRTTPVTGWRATSVLAVLALHPGAGVTRGGLIDVLWGSDPPASAVNAVQVQISRLRRILGATAIERLGDGYRLADHIVVDVTAVQAAVRDGRDALAAGDPDRAVRLLAEALAAWRGPSLAGRVAPGLAADAVRLDALRLEAQRARIDADLAMGRHEQVVEELRELVARHPLDERLRGQLMVSSYRCGRQAEALATYAEAVRVLADELGVDPTPELEVLHRRLLRHEDLGPALSPPPDPAPAAHPTGSRGAVEGQLVGRHAELCRLHAIADQVGVARTPHAVVVSGEGGLGKTALVQAFLASRDGAAALRGECLDLRIARVPFAPVAQALRPVLRRPDRWGIRIGPAARSALDRMIPGPYDPPTTPAAVEGVGLSHLYEGVLWVLEELAHTPQGLVVVIEDLHWCDPATLDLLTFLIANLAEAVTVVLTLRTNEIDRRHPGHQLLTALERSPRATAIAMEPLADAALAELVGPLLPDRHTLEAVLDRAGGNPLHAFELADGGGVVTDRLSDLLLARVDRCTPETQAVLRAMAAAGTDTDEATLAAVTGLPATTLADRLVEAVASNLVVAGRGGYRFRHALIAEAVEGELRPSEVVALHGRLADHLLAHGGLTGPDAAALARHLRAAGREVEELEAAYAAGRRALAVYAYRDAVAMSERVAELWPRVPDADRRTGTDLADVHEVAAVAALADLDHDHARVLAERALGHLDADVEPERVALVHVLLGRAHETDWGRAEAAYRTALAALPPGDSSARAHAEAAFATALMFEGCFPDASPLAEHAAAVAGRVGAAAAEADALITLAVLRGQRGRAEEAARLFDRAEEAADRSGSVLHRIRCARSRSGILANQGWFDAAIAECWRGIEIARCHGLDRTHGMHLRGNLLGPLTDAGRLAEALELGRGAVELVPDGRPRGALLTHAGTAAVRMGLLDEAERLRDQGAATMRGSQQASFRAFWSQLAAEIALARGDHQAALRHVQDGFRGVTTPGGPTIWAGEVGALYGEVVLAGGLDVDLGPVVAAVRAAAAEGETRIQTAERLRLQAVALQVSRAPLHQVQAAWEAALAAYRTMPMPERVARCQLALAGLHLDAGDRDRAQQAWSECVTTAEAVGAPPLVEAAQEVNRRAGMQWKRPRGGDSVR